ncbi:hypothetical protein [Dyadobacter chenhuakuii]|uniref:Uncharacterized protein n=1 Tax=Dyadobacter chenhuakuii TaxID=2909339 RepID=A0ABY4XJ28_9BACT|nr:hypothetical protein [Dyadobacter chenhuakuii]MCF2496396.1 hypothetical protein [Dyadobacter chenhuakuii]USJ30454.1 hypothetical protein NFI80_21660 [Dyadobacter chenhuakuii]
MESKIKTVRSIAKNEKERAAIDAFSQRKLEQAKKSLDKMDFSVFFDKKE